LALTLVYARFTRKTSVYTAPKRSKTRPPTSRLRQIIDEMGGTSPVAGNLVVALIVSLALYLLFYSSFFRNSAGIYDSLQTFAVWTKTGKTAHVHPPHMYLVWLV